ncbi:MAG: DUF998 domain-containing protein [Promethearchaeota archaeon]
MKNHIIYIKEIKEIKEIAEIELEKLYKKLLSKKIVRICIYITLITFYPGIILAIIIADIYGSERYNIRDNYISDLGSPHHTPAPYILNSIAISTAVLLIPIYLYLEEILVSGPNLSKRFLNKSISLKKIAYVGKICFIIGSIGMVGVGIFNEDFNPFYIHGILAFFLFVGFITGGLATGLIIILKKTIIPRVLGYIMIINATGIIFLYFFRFIPLFTPPLIEWCIFLSIVAWFLPITIILLNYLDKMKR